ncbi:hypothetical protein DFS33DRAFT_1359054 [Desarmillaria ectypa]|nr:hypothetical protein DFS33DRAFT_1359054 [Desarmillaria ectypa]
MVSDSTSLERMHQLYHLPFIPLPDKVSDPDILYRPEAVFELYPCSPPRCPPHDQCMYTEDALRLEKTEGLYAASITHRIPLPPDTQPSETIALRKKLCGGFREERVTHVWTATRGGEGGEMVIAKIFDPLYFIDPYEGTDPFPFVDLSVSREVEAYRRLQSLQGTQVPRFLGLFVSSLPSQGNRTIYVLLLEYVVGQDVRYLVPSPTSDSPPDSEDTVKHLCSAHRSAIVDAAVNVFYDILMCGVKQRDMAPRNVIIRPPRRGGGPFCAKEDCPVRFSVDASNVESVMIDFEGSELWDPNHEFYDKQTREREMRSLREDYLEDWWYGKFGI